MAHESRYGSTCPVPVIPAKAGIECLGRPGPRLELTPVETGAGVSWPSMSLGLRFGLASDSLRPEIDRGADRRILGAFPVLPLGGDRGLPPRAWRTTENIGYPGLGARGLVGFQGKRSGGRRHRAAQEYLIRGLSRRCRGAGVVGCRRWTMLGQEIDHGTLTSRHDGQGLFTEEIDHAVVSPARAGSLERAPCRMYRHAPEEA